MIRRRSRDRLRLRDYFGHGRQGEANQPFINNTVVVEIEMLMCATLL